jgi:hypothetical protein
MASYTNGRTLMILLLVAAISMAVAASTSPKLAKTPPPSGVATARDSGSTARTADDPLM